MSTLSARLERTLVWLLIRAYPPAFRAEYAAEMTEDVAQLSARAAGPGGRAGLWLRLTADTLRSAPRERWVSWRQRRRERIRNDVARPDYGGALLAALATFVLYRITLAPTVAFWDAGEYITVGHVLGIPHPPGNALFVLAARVWDVLLLPTNWPVAVRLNILSAVFSSSAHFFLYLCMERGLRGTSGDRTTRRIAAACAVVFSATAFTVWNQSNVNEKVYTVSFATTLATMWLGLRWRDTRDARLLILALYVTALTSVNHLMGVLVLPALFGFIALVDWRALLKPRLWLAGVPVAALALSAHLFLPLRAAERPVVNEPDPVCASIPSAAVSIYTNGARGCPALSATLSREQYRKPSIFTDPTTEGRPRDAALFALQLANYGQYLDWQWARSVAGTDPYYGGARPFFTLLMLLLIAAGARAHWRSDRAAAALHAALLLTLSIGLVFYLNFKYGFVMERDAAPADAMHEVRERDYFFLISFSLFGAWAGLGLAACWSAAAQWCAARVQRPRLVAAPVLLLALAPLVLNWSWASRADDWTARDWAYNALMSVGPYGVLVTNGDNDSFPLWYIQNVERVRPDVSIVLAPYLAFPWYARQVRDASRPCTDGLDARADLTRISCQHALQPDDIHPRLLAAWGGAPTAPPEDSILPLSDADIDTMSGNYFVTKQALSFTAGVISGTIAKGTLLTPTDTFIAAIIQRSLGRRPIHFMSPSPVIASLGLGAQTVRVGLTWRLRDGSSADHGLVALPVVSRGTTGAFIDLRTTDTLAHQVFVRRGRIMNPRLPWVDHATYSMPAQYALMHYAAAIGHELLSDVAAVETHVRQVEFWNRFSANSIGIGD